MCDKHFKFINNDLVYKFTMQFKEYAKTKENDLPPPLEIGTILTKITKVENNTFDLNGVPTKGMRVFADGKEYRTSSSVLMKNLNEFFEKNPNETLENVKVVQPRGKRYLTLESV